LFIANGGNVGIGTSSPDTKLHVAGTVTASEGFAMGNGDQISSTGSMFIDIDSNNDSTSATLDLTRDGKTKKTARFAENGDISFYEDTGTTPKLFWDASAQKLGIGTTSPAANLHVDASAPEFRLSQSGTAKVRLRTTGDNYINTGQNLGIGTSSPSTALHIGSGSDATIAQTMATNTGGVAEFRTTSTTGQFKFTKANGSIETMRIDSSGNVGIGTASPVYPLVVSNSGAQGLEFIVGNTNFIQSYNRSTSDYTPLKIDAETIAFATNNGSERMRIDASGNVRIGTVLPQTSAKFNLRRNGTNIEFGHGNTTSGYYGTLGAQFNNGQPYMGFSCDADDSGNTFTTRGFKGNALIGTTTGDLTFNQITSASASGQTPSERMRIDSSGNLLVGTTNTTSSATGFKWRNDLDRLLLVADGSTAAQFGRLTSDGDILSLQKDGSTVGSIGTSFSVPYLANGSNFGIRVDDAGSGELLPTDSTGSGVDAVANLGRSNIRFKDLYLSGGIYSGNPTNTAGNLFLHIDGDADGVSTGYKIRSGVGVSTASSHIAFVNPNGIVGQIRTDGSATSYNTSSDERLKQNIQDADDAGSKIDAIQVRQFDWKIDGTHESYGVIAQELQSVAPEAVSGNPESEEMMGVDYSKLVPTLIKEIQTLRNRVAQLENN